MTLTGRVLAGTSAAQPAPGWPTTNLKTILRDVDAATFAVIRYLDKTEAIVADAVWLNQLKRTLNAADSQPDKLCFCVNYPNITFANKDGVIASLEVPHDNKLRFGSDRYSGDFLVGEKIGRQVIKMLESQHEHAVSRSKPKVTAPPKIDIDLKNNQSPQPTQAKGG